MSNYLNQLVAKNLYTVDTIKPRSVSRFEPSFKTSFSTVETLEEETIYHASLSEYQATEPTEITDLTTQTDSLNNNTDLLNNNTNSLKKNISDDSVNFQSSSQNSSFNAVAETSLEKNPDIFQQSQLSPSSSADNSSLSHFSQLERQTTSLDVPNLTSSHVNPQSIPLDTLNPNPSLKPSDSSKTHLSSSNRDSLSLSHASSDHSSSEKNTDAKPSKPITSFTPSQPLQSRPHNLSSSSTSADKKNPANSQPNPSFIQPLDKDVSISQPSSQSISNPTIKVNIGRIEIRAVQPESVKPKPRSKSSTLSLNEYLQQRAKGVR